MARLTIKEAKQKVSIVEYLAHYGHHPIGMSGKRYRFCSVFREEKDASLFIDDELGLWNDFGHGGGSILDLVMEM